MAEFTRKSSRSPVLQKVAMERLRREINAAPVLSTKKATEARDSKIILRHLRSARGPASKLTTGRGN